MATSFPQAIPDWWDESSLDDKENMGLRKELPASRLEGDAIHTCRHWKGK